MIRTAKQEWDDVEPFVPYDRCVDMMELVKITGFSRLRVIHALVYAREHGLVEESTVTYYTNPDSGKRQKLRKSVYRARNSPTQHPTGNSTT
jgi:hypothetical protein